MPKNVQAERSVSVWMPVPEIPGHPVEDSRPCDLLVIGAGMAGLSIAYEALLKGRRVTVLDRGAIASGMTARTTAHLASAFDDFYHEFIARRSEEEARLLHDSLAASIDRIEEIARQESIDCDFTRCDGYLFLGEGDKITVLEKEIEACHRIGFSRVSWAKQAPMPSFDTGRCLRFPNQARFHPLKYLQGLARAILTKGGVLRPQTVVESVSPSGHEVAVKTAQGQTILARDVVVATNSPIVGPTTFHTKQAPYRTYAMAFSVPKGAIADALYWDTLDAYHYVRLQEGKDADFLIVGGEDHKTGEADDAAIRFDGLEIWTRQRFAPAGDVTHRWSGQVLEPVDFAGFVGRQPGGDHIYMVTGDSGQGITNGALAGLLIPALMEAGDHPWRELYDPGRVSVKAAGTFLNENVTALKGSAFGGSALFRGLAALPVLPVMPDTGPLQIVQRDDVVRTVLHFLKPDAPARLALDLAGPERLTFTQVVAVYRCWLGWRRARQWLMPAWLARLSYRLGDFVRALGWRPPLSSTARQEMVYGAVGDPAPWTAATGIVPAPLEQALAAEPASVQERWFAGLYLLKAVGFTVFSLFWLATGLISLTGGYPIGVALMREGGAGPLAGPSVIAGALADLAVGSAIAFRPTTRYGLYGAIALTLFYVVAGSILLPRLWLEPLGPLLKIWPILALNLILFAILEER